MDGKGQRTSKRGSATDAEGDDVTVCPHVEPDACETAEYLTQLLPELARMAERSGLDVAAYLLKVAQLEAEERLQERHDQRA